MREARTGYDQAYDNARELVHSTKQVTRRRFTPKEKVRIVIEGIRGDIPISVLCRRELGITYTPIQLAEEEAVSSCMAKAVRQDAMRTVGTAR
jgi:hypothetical protein